MTESLDNLKWDKCHGRKAKTIWFSGGQQQDNSELELVCVVDYRGDRDEIWICEVRDGKELARHNARAIESIVWETEP